MAKIMVVDDEAGIRELFSEILSDEGYEVILANNASKARELRKQAPDLILLDIWMPDTDGLSLLKEWVRDSQFDTPVIMMSGHGTVETAVEATGIGAVDYLEKPVSLQHLLNTIKGALKNKNVRNQQHMRNFQAPEAIFPELESDLKNSDAHQQNTKKIAEKIPEAAAETIFPSLLQKPLREARAGFEKYYLEVQIKRANGNLAQVARLTGLERTHLYRKLKQLGIHRSKS